MEYEPLRRCTLKKVGVYFRRSVPYSQSLWPCFPICGIGNIIPTSQGWWGLNVRIECVSGWCMSPFLGPCWWIKDRQRELLLQPILCLASSRVSRAGGWHLKICRTGLWTWPGGRGGALNSIQGCMKSGVGFSSKEGFFLLASLKWDFLFFSAHLTILLLCFCSIVTCFGLGKFIRPLSLQIGLRRTRTFVDFADWCHKRQPYLSRYFSESAQRQSQVCRHLLGIYWVTKAVPVLLDTRKWIPIVCSQELSGGGDPKHHSQEEKYLKIPNRLELFSKMIGTTIWVLMEKKAKPLWLMGNAIAIIF